MNPPPSEPSVRLWTMSVQMGRGAFAYEVHAYSENRLERLENPAEKFVLASEVASLRSAHAEEVAGKDARIAELELRLGESFEREATTQASLASRDAEIANIRRDLQDAYTEFYALKHALAAWPQLPKPHVLLRLDGGKFSEDWGRGKIMQRELGSSFIPYKTECEEGAGMWDRITEGKWRALLTPPSQAPEARRDVGGEKPATHNPEAKS